MTPEVATAAPVCKTVVPKVLLIVELGIIEGRRPGRMGIASAWTATAPSKITIVYIVEEKPVCFIVRFFRLGEPALRPTHDVSLKKLTLKALEDH